MRKLALLLGLLLFAAPASAGVPCSVPFNLQNATIADATQVMANYNAIITCLGNAAAAGPNNDITSLSALVTPIPPNLGGSFISLGSTSTGTNAQVVSTVTPSIFPLTAGRSVLFTVGAGNTGPTTLNVGSSGTVNLYRRTQLGISPMVGGELVAGHPAIAEYDGTEYVLISTGPYLVGEIRDYAGSAAPPGWAFIDGSCQTRTTFPDLFTVIGTAFDPTGTTCDTAHFALPDGRGRALVGQDNMGVGAASRITSGGSSCNGTVIGGAGCGLQAANIAQNQLPNIAPIFTGNDMGSHSHGAAGGGQFAQTGGSGTTTAVFGASGGIVNPNTASVDIGIPTGTISSINGNVTQQSFVKLPPLQIVTKIIKL